MNGIYQAAFWMVIHGRIPSNHWPSEVLNFCTKKLTKRDNSWEGMSLSYTPNGVYLEVNDNAEDEQDSTG